MASRLDLNFDAALAACHQDLLGDWYRDPWGWPELDWLVQSKSDLLRQDLNRHQARAVAKIDIPKENFAVRPAVVMEPLDRLIYQALCGEISVPLIGNLSKNAYGWRLPVRDIKPGSFSPNDKQWDRYRSYLSFLAGEFDVTLKTDVVSCFASIPIPRLIQEIEARVTRSASRPILDALITRLEAWNRIAGRSGIPQRFQASSVLANMYLSTLDEVLELNSSEVDYFDSTRRSYVRWMDDIWVFGNDAGELRRTQVELNGALNDLGLHMNSGKTELLEGEAVLPAAREIEHSAIDDDLTFTLLINGKPTRRFDRLDELIERIVDAKENASRTSIRFATTRMRTHKHFAKVDDLVDVGMRLPHGADHLARLFRDAGRSNDLEDWYLDYLSRPWSTIEWSAAQLATMFPSKRAASDAVVEKLESAIYRSGTSLPMVAVAAQRISKWYPRRARIVLADAAKKAESPLIRRVLALAGVEAGCSKTSVERWLNEFEENRTTLEMLRAQSFKKLPLKPDFEGW